MVQSEAAQQLVESETAYSANSVDGDNPAAGSSVEEASGEAGTEEESGASAGDASNSLGMSAFEFIYVDQKTVSIGRAQSVAISFVNHESAFSNAEDCGVNKWLKLPGARLKRERR